MRYKKTQEGMFIALFALATVVIIGILVSYMSNWVNDMVATQTQVFFSKQAYWNTYSGMEIATSKKIASPDDIPNADVSFSTGTITIARTTTANEYLGGNKVSTITSTGSDLRGRSRAMKLTIGDPSSAEYALFFDGSIGKYVDIGTIEDNMEMQLSCNQDVGGHSSKTLCDDGAAGHVPEGTGHFNKITYALDDAQADFSISLWLRPDYSAMPGFGVFFAANNCDDVGQDGCNNERGLVMGLTNDDPGYLRIWHDGNPTDPTEFSSTGVSADIWNHVTYTRSATTPGSGVGTIYLNGVLLGTENPDNSWFKSAADGELWHLDTDIDVGPVKSKNYAGGLDEVAIWRKVLSLAEIQSLYTQGMLFDIATNMGTDLVAYWDFDNTSNDQSGNNNTATITGADYTGF